jgi:hypothetical protein
MANETLYEVRIKYEGTSTYFVQADNSEDAAEEASSLFKNGADGTSTGVEYEKIENIIVVGSFTRKEVR